MDYSKLHNHQHMGYLLLGRAHSNMKVVMAGKDSNVVVVELKMIVFCIIL